MDNYQELLKDRAALKEFIRQKGLTKKDFYLQYIGKKDLLTGQALPFKDEKSYLELDFLNKNNLMKWLKEQEAKDARAYLGKKIKERAEEKSWKFIPSQAELRTLKSLPSMKVLLKYFKAEELKHSKTLVCRYEYGTSPIERHLGVDLDIIQDTREQTPLKFSKPTVISKLDYGDYTAANQWFDNVFVERKSLPDFTQTISRGFVRFCDEIERAKLLNSYLVVVVESSFSGFEGLEYNYLSKFTKCTFSYLAHQLRDIMQKYDNIQFVFVDGRGESVRVIEKIFKIGSDVKKLDLQYFYDIKEL